MRRSSAAVWLVLAGMLAATLLLRPSLAEPPTPPTLPPPTSPPTPPADVTAPPTGVVIDVSMKSAPAQPPTSQPDARHHGAANSIQIQSSVQVPWGRSEPPLTEEQIARAVRYLQADQPEVAAALERIKRDDPEHYQARVQRTARAALFMLDLKGRDPARYNLILEDMKIGQRVNRLAAAISEAAEESARSDLIAKLRQELAQRFEVNQERQRLEIVQMKKRIERLESMLQLREARKDSIIEEQLKWLLESEARRHGRRPPPPPPPPPPPSTMPDDAPSPGPPPSMPYRKN